MKKDYSKEDALTIQEQYELLNKVEALESLVFAIIDSVQGQLQNNDLTIVLEKEYEDYREVISNGTN